MHISNLDIMACVWVGMDVSGGFPVDAGLRQGGVMFPCIF